MLSHLKNDLISSTSRLHGTIRNLYPDLLTLVLIDTEKKCNICGEEFENSDKLKQHIKESHQEKTKAKTQVSKSSRYKATGIAAAIAVAIIIVVYFSDSATSTGTIQGVGCDPLEGTVSHIHAHLDLVVDSKPITIPAEIGIKPNECLYWLHTHNTSGVIHIESPQLTTFTLGQFIQVWDNTAGISPTFEGVTHGDKNIKVFVNGTEVKNSYENIKLSVHDEIVLVSGSMPPVIPSSYEFNGL